MTNKHENGVIHLTVVSSFSFLNGNIHHMSTKLRPSDYKTLYESCSREFWALQQKEQTAEEAELNDLCKELESLLENYRNEITQLEQENLRLQDDVQSFSEIKQKYESLADEEERLTRLAKELGL